MLEIERIGEGKLLDILVVSLKEVRKLSRNELIACLKPQLVEGVGVIILMDNGEYTVGEKRNLVVKESKAEYVCFVDDDDLVSPTYVQDTVAALKTEPDCVGLQIVKKWEGKPDTISNSSLTITEWKEISPTEYEQPIGHLNPLKRSIYSLVSICPTNYGEDKFFAKDISKLLKTCVRASNGPHYIYQFRERSECVKADIELKSEGLDILAGKPFPRLKVTAEVSTRGRYHSTLALCLTGIANQIVPPDELIIFDDNSPMIRLDQHPLYRYILGMLTARGIEWKVAEGKRQGQVANHQTALEIAKHPLIIRIDDDEIMDPPTLMALLEMMSWGVGAVAGRILDPTCPSGPLPFASSLMKDMYCNAGNMQWFAFDKPMEVDHLYSSFLYNKNAAKHGYCKDLSIVGHREETMFTYQMRRAGWKLILTPKATTWHLRYPEGGIRSEKDGSLWGKDEEVFKRYMSLWKEVVLSNPRLIAATHAYGDQVILRSAMDEILKNNQGRQIILGTNMPDIFKDVKGIDMVPLQVVERMISSMGKNINGPEFSIYAFGGEKKWQGHLKDAYVEMYR